MVVSKPMSKRHKSRLGAKASDQIRDLPDPVFEHILSFLPTKQAITTCLLSKRWSHLRLSLPSLDLDDSSFHSLHSFLQYVETVMSMRDHSETLRKFHLTLRSTRGGNVPRMKKINTWINTAVNAKVEDVEIYDKTLNKFKIDIPSCIFNCNTMRILKLSGVKVTTPPFIHLPSLEVLHLSKVIFPNIKGVYNLLCGCPLLQDLSLKYCSTIYLDGHRIVPINEENLIKALVSADVYHYPFTLEERLKNLVSADVYGYPFTLGSLSNVTALRIDKFGVSYPPDIPTFYNLIHMEIRYYPPGVSRTTILECLRKCPKLETLTIDEFNCTARLRNNVPPCVSSNLKEFHLVNYRGLDNEFKLARFIMEQARVLKIISIRINSKANSEQEIMLKRLSSCTISSVNCRLVFN